MAAPVIKSFSPTKGWAGAVITCTGSGFSGLTSVGVGSLNIPKFVVVNDAEFTFVLPSGATTGRISIMTPNGPGKGVGLLTVTPLVMQPDLAYLPSRIGLEPYEQSAFAALRSFVPDYYPDGRDDTVWGSHLRAIAAMLARVNWKFQYDMVSRNPQYLNPADALRRYGQTLKLSRSYPGTTQYDLAFSFMVQTLVAAYSQGCTLAALQGVLNAYLGQNNGVDNFVVTELYTLIGKTATMADHNTVRVAFNLSSEDKALSTDVTRAATIVQDIYTAIDLAKPAHIGVNLTAIMGQDEQLWDYITGPVHTNPPNGLTAISYFDSAKGYGVGDIFYDGPYPAWTGAKPRFSLDAKEDDDPLASPSYYTGAGTATPEDFYAYQIVAFKTPPAKNAVQRLAPNVTLFNPLPGDNDAGMTPEVINLGIQDALFIRMTTFDGDPNFVQLVQAPHLDHSTEDPMTGQAPSVLNLSFQWYQQLNDVLTPVPGATTSYLSFQNVQATSEGAYCLKVSEPNLGTLWSNLVSLMVYPVGTTLPRPGKAMPAPYAPVGSLAFQLPPMSIAATEGTTAMFTSVVENTVVPGNLAPYINQAWEIGNDTLLGLDLD